MSEIQRRNSMYPPHMRSAYAAEMQTASIPLSDDQLRDGTNQSEENMWVDLTKAAEELGLDSPGYNLRKRKSYNDSISSEASLDSTAGRKAKKMSVSISPFKF